MAFYLYIISSGEAVRESSTGDFGTIKTGWAVVELPKTKLPRPWFYNGSTIVTPTDTQLSAFPAGGAEVELQLIRERAEKELSNPRSGNGQLIRAISLVIRDLINPLNSAAGLPPIRKNQIRKAIRDALRAKRAD